MEESSEQPKDCLKGLPILETKDEPNSLGVCEDVDECLLSMSLQFSLVADHLDSMLDKIKDLGTPEDVEEGDNISCSGFEDAGKIDDSLKQELDDTKLWVDTDKIQSNSTSALGILHEGMNYIYVPYLHGMTCFPVPFQVQASATVKLSKLLFHKLPSCLSLESNGN